MAAGGPQVVVGAGEDDRALAGLGMGLQQIPAARQVGEAVGLDEIPALVVDQGLEGQAVQLTVGGQVDQGGRAQGRPQGGEDLLVQWPAHLAEALLPGPLGLGESRFVGLGERVSSLPAPMTLCRTCSTASSMSAASPKSIKRGGAWAPAVNTKAR